MELGEKLRHARLEAGMSQRQLCGEEITRNMLSQIEHGTAKPSMGTLTYLAARLGKPVSFFLEETAVCSPNKTVMESARRRYDAGDHTAAAQVLADYRGPDAIFDREYRLLLLLANLSQAEAAIRAGREPYARELLEKAEALEKETPYCAKELKHRRLLLLGRLPGGSGVCSQLPDLDGELLLRAEAALAAGDTGRAVHLLEAAEAHETPRWNYLRGESHMARKEFRDAARCFHAAEEAYPKETAARLETCYRELEDYKRAYEYAGRQKE